MDSAWLNEICKAENSEIYYKTLLVLFAIAVALFIMLFKEKGEV